MRKKHNQLIPCYSEELVGLIVESYFAMISFPCRYLYLMPFSRREESDIGADARVNSLKMTPFYLQFKRPEAYLKVSPSQIIKDRNQFSLNCDPHALFFELRQKAKNAKDFQHNLLYELNKNGDAAYVCPLYLKEAEYRKKVHLFALRNWQRFSNLRPNSFQILEVVNNRKKSLKIKLNLPGHIVFPPHNRVGKHNHKYSFSIVGDDLCFHSPQRIEENPLTMLEFLTKVRNEFLAQIDKDDGDRVLTAENAKERLSTLTESLEMNLKFESPRSDGRDPENPFAGWLEWGAFLREKYKIHQYMMIKSDWSHILPIQHPWPVLIALDDAVFFIGFPLRAHAKRIIQIELAIDDGESLWDGGGGVA